MKIRSSLSFLLVLLMVSLVLIPAVATAQYPDRPITMVVPWGAGGGTDVLMRIVAKYLEEELGQPVVVVNKPGAAGSLGARDVMRAKADGYTILAGNDSIGMAYATEVADFSYSAFETIGLITSTPMVVATHADNPWASLTELVDWAKANPGKLKFGATLGSTTQLLPSALISRAGLNIRIVGYDGTGPRMNALLGQHIDVGETDMAAGIEYVKAGQLRLLAITTEKRHPSLPDLPTLKEQGINFTFAANRGFFAPPKTPENVIATLVAALERVSNNPSFIREIEALGSDVQFMDRDAYAAYLETTESDFVELVKSLEL